ncbi:hypothetical protein SAMN05216188_12397 [Lentzea xinjiangensis]|uniref:Transcriptional regulator SbtR-like C-terminal domain-containing protein n=1 Tax=Lentzea xinjiangensis TaxID=402600 RepID=A0A1H9V1D1_9PSEU|nr:hypothetical protein SAMN05216188_12397 [Lentzea xinjiangensis]
MPVGGSHGSSARWATAFDGFPESLRLTLTGNNSPLSVTCQGYVKITDDFLAAAQRDGGARPEVRGRDLFLVALAISWVRGAAMADESSHPGLCALLRTGWENPDDRSADR